MDWTLAFMGVAFITAFAAIYYVDYLRARDLKQEKTDPVYKGIFLSLIISAIIIFAELGGFFEHGWNQEHFYIHLAIPGVILAIYFWVVRQKTPLSYSELYWCAMAHVRGVYPGAHQLIGATNWNTVQFYRLEQNSDFAVFYFVLYDFEVFMPLLKLNQFTGALHSIERSIPAYIHRSELLHPILPSKHNPVVDEFNMGEPEQPAPVALQQKQN